MLFHIKAVYDTVYALREVLASHCNLSLTAHILLAKTFPLYAAL